MTAAPLVRHPQSSPQRLAPSSRIPIAYTQDVLTVPASLAGLPALSVPIAVRGGEGNGWPLGVSVVGQWGCERMALAVGATIEDAEREVLQS